MDSQLTHLELPPGFAENAAPKLPFYLAMEEFAARNLKGEYFFMWQVDPTVIYGRNQQPELEFNADYCHEHGIETYRRKSGGGCVYADRNNIMFSHIADCSDVAETFAKYTSTIAHWLNLLGIKDAKASGRNDIMIGQHKVSGYAFYLVKNAFTGSERAIVHGTMLYDADPVEMDSILTPDADKLARHGVQSVRQRITTIREHISIRLCDFKNEAIQYLCHNTCHLTEEDIAQIRIIEQQYYQ